MSLDSNWDLKGLVSPMQPEQFLTCYSEQVPVFIHGADPLRGAQLVTVNEATELVAQGLHPDGRISMRKDTRRSRSMTSRPSRPPRSAPLAVSSAYRPPP